MLSTTYVRLEAHRDTILVAILSAHRERLVEFEVPRSRRRNASAGLQTAGIPRLGQEWHGRR
jgi:hypothetical protein